MDYGYPPELFGLTDEEETGLRCGVCYQIVRDPVRCANGHLFCRNCIAKWMIARRNTVTDDGDNFEADFDDDADGDDIIPYIPFNAAPANNASADDDDADHADGGGSETESTAAYSVSASTVDSVADGSETLDGDAVVQFAEDDGVDDVNSADDNVCPVCTAVGPFAPAPDVDRRIDERIVHCPISACSWTGRFADYRVHRPSHDHGDVLAATNGDVVDAFDGDGGMWADGGVAGSGFGTQGVGELAVGTAGASSAPVAGHQSAASRKRPADGGVPYSAPSLPKRMFLTYTSVTITALRGGIAVMQGLQRFVAEDGDIAAQWNGLLGEAPAAAGNFDDNWGDDLDGLGWDEDENDDMDEENEDDEDGDEEEEEDDEEDEEDEDDDEDEEEEEQEEEEEEEEEV